MEERGDEAQKVESETDLEGTPARDARGGRTGRPPAETCTRHPAPKPSNLDTPVLPWCQVENKQRALKEKFHTIQTEIRNSVERADQALL